jgi:DNA-binding FadR family transcriptional regulator
MAYYHDVKEATAIIKKIAVSEEMVDIKTIEAEIFFKFGFGKKVVRNALAMLQEKGDLKIEGECVRRTE